MLPFATRDLNGYKFCENPQRSSFTWFKFESWFMSVPDWFDICVTLAVSVTAARVTTTLSQCCNKVSQQTVTTASVTTDCNNRL